MSSVNEMDENVVGKGENAGFLHMCLEVIFFRAREAPAYCTASIPVHEPFNKQQNFKLD